MKNKLRYSPKDGWELEEIGMQWHEWYTQWEIEHKKQEAAMGDYELDTIEQLRKRIAELEKEFEDAESAYFKGVESGLETLEKEIADNRKKDQRIAELEKELEDMKEWLQKISYTPPPPPLEEGGE